MMMRFPLRQRLASDGTSAVAAVPLLVGVVAIGGAIVGWHSNDASPAGAMPPEPQSLPTRYISAALQDSETATDDDSGVEFPLPTVTALTEQVANTPRTVQEMVQLESKLRDVVLKAVPATVGVRVRSGQGSGVIISPDGYVLTAAHVSGEPNQSAQIILSDGRMLRAITLGRHRALDASLMKIEDNQAGKLPFAELGVSHDLEVGSWTVATGHPGGYESGRPPVVRVGRVNANTDEFLQTDNTLVGGDSGGPLFDIEGRVIGIHSRIGNSLARNVHVPIDVYLAGWAKMAGGQDVDQGNRFLQFRNSRPVGDDGVRLDLTEKDPADTGAAVHWLEPDGPAAKAGIQVGDRIVEIGEWTIDGSTELMIRRRAMEPGKALTYRVMRDGEKLEFLVTPVAPVEIRPEWERARQSRGRETRAAIGIAYPIEPAEPDGIRFARLTPGGPLDKAGITAEDVILAMNGVAVRDVDDLGRVMRPLRGGDLIRVVLSRNGDRVEVDVTTVAYDDLY